MGDSRALAMIREPLEGQLISEGSRQYFHSLTVEELQNKISGMIRTVEGSLGRVNAVMRSELLPALEVLRERIPHGRWEIFLREHRLNPSTVRNWRARGKGEVQRLSEILGDAPPRKVPRKKRQLGESEAQLLAKAGKRLAEEVLNGKPAYAKKLAAELLEAWQSAGRSIA